MNERINKLKEAVTRDEEHIVKLQNNIKTNKEKIAELERTDLLNNLNSISANGIPVSDIVEAIKTKNLDVLVSLMSDEIKPQTDAEPKSGTGSAFDNEIIKEDNGNE